MISTADFKNGLGLIYRGEPWVIVEFQHVKPGKGGAFVRTKLRSVKSGNVLEETFRSGEQFEPADLMHRRLQYLYEDQGLLHFMDDEYEQHMVKAEVIGDKRMFLSEDAKVDGVFLAGDMIDIQLPAKMDFAVEEAPPGVKGDSQSGAKKSVRLENGAEISVPLFIKKGDTVRVSTDTGQYVERVTE